MILFYEDLIRSMMYGSFHIQTPSIDRPTMDKLPVEKNPDRSNWNATSVRGETLRYKTSVCTTVTSKVVLILAHPLKENGLRLCSESQLDIIERPIVQILVDGPDQ